MSRLAEDFIKFKDVVPEVSEYEVALYDRYLDLLKEWNQKFNLVSRASLENAFSAHIVDSIYISDFAKKNMIGSMIDLGSGAGLPGIIFSIRHKLSIRLYERTGKKRVFLEMVSQELGLPVTVLSDFQNLRERVTVMARAVLPPTELISYVKDRLQLGSRLIIPFGKKDSPTSLKSKLMKLEDVLEYELPGDNIHRTVAVFERCST